MRQTIQKNIYIWQVMWGIDSNKQAHVVSFLTDIVSANGINTVGLIEAIMKLVLRKIIDGWLKTHLK